MNPTTALGQADPARELPPREPDERLLHEILSSDPRPTALVETRSRTTPRRDRRPLVATAFVGVAVVAVAVIAIRLPGASHSSPAATSGSARHALEDAVFAKLDQVNTGDIPVQQKSATTWSDSLTGADGGALDLSNRTLYIAAACDGGGTIAIRLTGHGDQSLNCSTPSTLGPIDLTAEIPATHDTAGLDVVVTSGHPRYIAKAMAFPDPSPTP